MNHQIPVARLGPGGPAMTRAIEACVHCGFCLPACPTYRVLGEEMDSPRGRILLMKNALEGAVDIAETLSFIDRCLGCLSCVTACPSGVRYDQLLPLYRDHAASRRREPLVERVSRALAHGILPYARRARLALSLGRLVRPLASRLPARFAAMAELIPEALPAADPLPASAPAIGPRRARVALLAGCIQSVLAPGISHATIRVLTRNGVEVVVPREQACCGALALHAGELARARALALPALDAWPTDVDAIITSAAGCGSAMQEYPLLFDGTPHDAKARAVASKVRDIAAFLAELGLVGRPSLPSPLTVAYHDACHLAHAQRVSEAPRALLRQIDGVSVVEIADADMCCGSAGTYNIDQPDIAGALGERKAHAILATGAQAVAAGNIGCIVQIRAHLERLGRPIPVRHTMEVLDAAYLGEWPGSSP
jgi:glycolate oxidase iron-sulfur subunit